MRLSFIIATRNRETLLSESLSYALPILDKYAGVECMIINDGDQPIPHHIESPQIKYFENDLKGVGNARNLGARHALGDYLFFMDDDIWPTVHFVDWFINAVQEPNFGASVYNINWHYPANLLSKLRDYKVGRYLLKYSYHTMWGRMGHLDQEPSSGKTQATGIGSCSFLIKKSLFEALGGYHQDIRFQGEDLELSDRIHQANIMIYAVFDTRVYHNHADRLQIQEYLQREYQGYLSEYESRADGYLATHANEWTKNLFFELLRPWEQLIIRILQHSPNSKPLDGLHLKIVGTLSALQKHKAKKKWSQKK